MARAGLGSGWECLFANDFDHKKSAAYCENWGDEALKTCDVGLLKTQDLPGCADLAWASFPCQDLSLAGGGAGLKGERSGTFCPFWDLMKAMSKDGKPPTMIVLENVTGALTSHGGKDFSAICGALANERYAFGAIIVDAALFVPQSRPRLFIIAVRSSSAIPASLIGEGPQSPSHTRSLQAAHSKLPWDIKENWIWWRLDAPGKRAAALSDIIENDPKDVAWNTPEQTDRLLAMMSDVNLAKIQAAKKRGRKIVGAIYKRTRRDETGRRVQRAEVRFDDVAGCLRTPAGGSSRQIIIMVHGENIETRLISSRETARLMGIPDDYVLPPRYNEAYHLTGDGVVVPVVRHLAAHILEPLLEEQTRMDRKAA
uniref:DNA (cytosine-5-)-methyltransferase n=1 Tax=Candidatus Kentrum sp. LPFa TaxID=2126335 RepID=A0A450X0Z1_9GAMM|nr:MAG: DNA (cytosine-5)-methyltransferase 1 [Candidatus Kentron sp. LPFa]VFK22945.1 MAG: DNA (cytosine-5)-methyltransferase 1 [Candidatus Kentron sp. LPFa]